jgi:transcriptional regulator with XRE-family HTH domain
MAQANRYDLFQNALVEARQKKGLTQSEVALRVDRPQSFVSKYESGERRLDVVEFVEICEALSANPHEVLTILIEQDDNRA